MTLTANVVRSTFTGVDASAIVSGTLPVLRGGSGTTNSTGSGNLVLSDTPMLANVNVTNTLYFGNVTSNLSLYAGNGTIGFGSGGTEQAQVTTQGIVLKVGSAAAPSLTFAGNATTGLYLASANIIGLSTAGTERMQINDSNVSVTGNVIISGYVKQQLLSYVRQGFALATNGFATTYTNLSTNGLSGYITYTVDATNGDYFTVNRAGVYSLCARMTMNITTGGNTTAGFVKNGTNSANPYMGFSNVNFSTYWFEHTVNAVIALQANDTIRLNVQSASTRTLGTNGTDASMTYTILYMYGI